MSKGGNMKKILSLLLAIISLTVIICSCGQPVKPVGTETDTNGEIITTTTTKEQATTKVTSKETTGKATETTKNTETTKKNDKFEFPEDHYIKTGYKLTAQLAPVFVETPSRVILSCGINGQINYYSNADGGLYTFCYDPLCDHGNTNCVASRFSFSYLSQPAYLGYSNRVYLPYKDCLYSSKFDGSDLKLELALGDHGKEFDPMDHSEEAIIYVQTYDNYIYFTFPSIIEIKNYNGTGRTVKELHYSLYRFNIDTKNVENLFENVGYTTGKNFKSFYISKNNIYFSDVTDDGRKTFSANLDMTGLRELNLETKYSNMLANEYVIFDGDKFYSMVSENTDNNNKTGYIISFDPETEKIETVYACSIKTETQNGIKLSLGHFKLNAVTDEYIYFSVDENPFLVGKYKTKSGDSYI